jgi:hypothetical protein
VVKKKLSLLIETQTLSNTMPCKKCANCGTKVPKSKRAPNAYNLFVQKAMGLPQVKELDPKSRMKAVAALWRQEKQNGS